MSETARWGLPLLAAGQAQKEMTHNEALAALDVLTMASVEAVGVATPPANPVAGQCWIVGAAPTGAWAGRASALAGWTEAGWRFQPAREGMAVWSLADGCSAVRTGGAWRVGRLAARALWVGDDQVVGARQPAVTAPAGGGVVDTEARAALSAVLTALRAHGLIGS